MDYALGGQVADHFCGDEGVVFRRSQPLGDCFEGHEEGLEIGVDVDRFGLVEGQRLRIMAFGEDDEGLRRDGAFKVEVELGFGEMTKPEGDIGFCGAGHGSSLVERFEWTDVERAGDGVERCLGEEREQREAFELRGETDAVEDQL